MIATKCMKLLQLVVILTLCNCQEYHIKPDKCLQEECCSYPPPDCMTLSEYVLNDSNYSNLILSPGEYYLNSTLMINGTSTNTQDFSIIGSGSETTSIICTQNAIFNASGFSSLTIENVSFVSCGVDTTPGVSLNNIGTVNITDTSFSKSTSGALDIRNCQQTEIIDLYITNNMNSTSTIVSLSSTATVLRNLHIKNNSVGIYNSTCDFPNSNKVVLGIDGGNINANNILVTDNVGPFGILSITNAVVTVNSDWRFERNRVCVGGSLALNRTIANFYGNLYFSENNCFNQNNHSTPALFLVDSRLEVNSTLEFVRNVGRIASFQCTGSRLIVRGLLNMTENIDSYSLVLLSTDTRLIVDGWFILHNNILRYRTLVCQPSHILLSGNVSVLNNQGTPFVSSNGKIKMDGQIEFRNNSGILYAGNSNIQFTGNSIFVANSVENSYTDGALAIVQSTLIIEGSYVFRDSHYDDENGGGIYATVDSTVTLGGTGHFINNTANNGGGIFIDQLSRLELRKGTRLHFFENRAVRGAGIFISTSLEHTQCQLNPNECLFGFGDKDDPDVSLVFQDNIANPGASVIHVNFDEINERDIKFPALNDLNRTVDVNSLIGNSLPLYDSDTFWFCFCEDDLRENCIRDDPPANITVFKGKPFSIRARSLKFFGDNMSEPVRATLESSLSAVDSDSSVDATLTADNGRLQVASAMQCSNFSFTVRSAADEEVIVMNVGETFIGVDKTLRVNVNFSTSCPPGFLFDDNRDSCECDDTIERFLRSCRITDTEFRKRFGFIDYWMAPSPDPRHEGAMNYYDNCPHLYCVRREGFTFSDDGICANYRSGLLCGECIEHYSLLLGGDRCGDCSDNSYLALILIFAVAGVLLIAFIFLTQITVTTGTINGLIFYANILNSNQSVFFPDGFFPGYYVFISWLNLNFGIETCFFDGMNQISYTGLQFLFPLYMWFLAGVIIVLCQYSIRVSKLFQNSDPVAVLATIILLSFNSLVYNVINIFYYSSLYIPDGRHAVWRFDGNVTYGTGAHLLLILVATAFILLALIPYILVLLLAPFLQKNKLFSKIICKFKLQPFIYAYLIPFKPRHRYWVGLIVLTRVLLLVLFAFGENRQLNLLFIVTACVLGISMFSITKGIYDNSWIDKLEVSYLINLGVLAAATSYVESQSQSERYGIPTYVSITVALLTFVGILIYHTYLQFKKMIQKKKSEAVKNEVKDCDVEIATPRTSAFYNMDSVINFPDSRD